ncbi:hypothetical protein JNUCC1_01517 [Lentibacillus sp. JNUCC-1]|uniref:hypothetical protein n=1 Tax=Lentibacillus sp. JNUCC-1 TaxID=2654513 RepID=UPI0012E9797C|nr:hypothetical protein [Lentibacillus sp. JNUCC-1]MUV37711.1 hypothetical protein [Lentibacillus sp. JNUCC-1]
MKSFFMLLIVKLIVIAGCNQLDTSIYLNRTTSISEFQSSADYEVPGNVNDLINFSTYIVKVKALHDLGNDVIDGQVFGSKKKVSVIKSYTQDIGNDEIVVIEPGHVQDGKYISTEAYIKMLDGEEYFLFLFDGDNKNEYGIASLGYGKYSINKSAKYGEITGFNTFSDLEQFSFLSNDLEEVALYEELQEEILQKFK